jgi:eukaryotic-like serine/threonine-protein kinase
MPLAAEDLATLSRLLDEALEMPAEHQAGWMESLGAEYQPLRSLLQELLDEEGGDEDKDDDLLAQLPQWAFRIAEQRLAETNAPRAGDSVGPYRLIEQLGCGGMGAVWLAERENGKFKRKVALKLPFMGAHQHQLAQRFERECAILETLEHRHIARLYDTGIAANGQRYLALQHVAGVPITEYCDGARLTVRERVKLFLQVLQAVQYAHSRLVVHRDLKPSNIFVTHEGEVQLLDFGVATLLDDGDGSRPAITEFGHSALTPDYASPEQVAGETIGTASDVYSLGVVFYELLTGQRPYRLPRDTRAALEQAILDADTVRPSRAVLYSQAVASARSTTVKQLKRELQGDLDTIAMAALKKNQCERYASAESFHRDLERWLACERVQAYPDSLVYRLRTFMRRNRLAMSAGVVAGSALLVGFGSAIYQAQVAREQTVLAQRQAEKARAVQDFLVGLFKAADPVAARGHDVTVRDLMARGEADLKTKLAAEPELSEALSGALVEIYFKLADDKRALPLAQSRSDFALHAHGGHSVEYGDALLSLGKVQVRLAQYKSALKSLMQAKTLLEQDPQERQKDLLSIPRQIAISLMSMGQPTKAREWLVQALPKVQSYFGENSWEVVEYKSVMAVTHALEGDHRRATAVYEELEPMLRALPAEHLLVELEIRGDMGLSYYLIGQWDLAAMSLQRVVVEYDRLAGPNNSASVAALQMAGRVQADAGDYVRSATAFDASIRRAIECYGPEGDLTARIRSTSIPTLLWLGRHAEAERVGRETVEIGRRSKTLSDASLRKMVRELSLALIVNGKPGEAMQLLQDLPRVNSQESLEAKVEDASTLLYSAGALSALGRLEEAAVAARQAGDLWSKDTTVLQRLMVANARLTEALVRVQLGQVAAARALTDDAEKSLRRIVAAHHPLFERVQMVRGKLAAAAGHKEDAERAQALARKRFHAASGGTIPQNLVLFF